MCLCVYLDRWKYRVSNRKQYLDFLDTSMTQKYSMSEVLFPVLQIKRKEMLRLVWRIKKAEHIQSTAVWKLLEMNIHDSFQYIFFLIPVIHLQIENVPETEMWELTCSDFRLVSLVNQC